MAGPWPLKFTCIVSMDLGRPWKTTNYKYKYKYKYKTRGVTGELYSFISINTCKYSSRTPSTTLCRLVGIRGREGRGEYLRPLVACQWVSTSIRDLSSKRTRGLVELGDIKYHCIGAISLPRRAADPSERAEQSRAALQRERDRQTDRAVACAVGLFSLTFTSRGTPATRIPSPDISAVK